MGGGEGEGEGGGICINITCELRLKYTVAKTRITHVQYMQLAYGTRK